MTLEEILVNDYIVVSMAYTLTVDGEVVDASTGDEAIDFIQGQGHIVPGLEKELYGMAVKDKKQVVVQPEDGYGEYDPEAFVSVARSDFPAEMPLEVDVPLQIHTSDGEVLDARIVEYSDEEIKLDLNHILAGKELHFEVEITGLRFATPEEIAHGHIHSGNHDGEHGDLD